MVNNIVLETTEDLIKNPKYVQINDKRLEEVSQRFSQEKLELPIWDAPVFLDGKTPEVIDFFMLGNSINFAYTDFQTKVKYQKSALGNNWSGAYGMWAALKQALVDGIPILNADYLAGITNEDMKKIFSGNIEIPLLKQRTEIFQEIGKELLDVYGGHFYNLVESSNARLFDNGSGIVERLAIDFNSFNDSVFFNGKFVRFDKRAQLAPAMLYERFENSGLFQIKDIDELTVFADYELPKALRNLSILVYEESLAKRVDGQELIQSGSLEELEIRASTIHAANRMIKIINENRKPEDRINALHMDYKLWQEGRKDKTAVHHLTITTNY